MTLGGSQSRKDGCRKTVERISAADVAPVGLADRIRVGEVIGQSRWLPQCCATERELLPACAFRSSTRGSSSGSRLGSIVLTIKRRKPPALPPRLVGVLAKPGPEGNNG